MIIHSFFYENEWEYRAVRDAFVCYVLICSILWYLHFYFIGILYFTLGATIWWGEEPEDDPHLPVVDGSWKDDDEKDLDENRYFRDEREFFELPSEDYSKVIPEQFMGLELDYMYIADIMESRNLIDGEYKENPVYESCHRINLQNWVNEMSYLKKRKSPLIEKLIDFAFIKEANKTTRMDFSSMTETRKTLIEIMTTRSKFDGLRQVRIESTIQHEKLLDTFLNQGFFGNTDYDYEEAICHSSLLYEPCRHYEDLYSEGIGYVHMKDEEVDIRASHWDTAAPMFISGYEARERDLKERDSYDSLGTRYERLSYGQMRNNINNYTAEEFHDYLQFIRYRVIGERFKRGYRWQDDYLKKWWLEDKKNVIEIATGVKREKMNEWWNHLDKYKKKDNEFTIIDLNKRIKEIKNLKNIDINTIYKKYLSLNSTLRSHYNTTIDLRNETDPSYKVFRKKRIKKKINKKK